MSISIKTLFILISLLLSISISTFIQTSSYKATSITLLDDNKSLFQSNGTPINSTHYNLWNQIINTNWICNGNTCPSTRGKCIDNHICQCSPLYANANSQDKGCNYQKNHQLTFLIFEALLSLGIGHFLVGNTFIGFFKLLLGFTPCLFGILSACSVLPIKQYENFFGSCTAIIILTCAFAFMVWWFIDIIFILFTSIYNCDSNGIALVPIFNNEFMCSSSH